jgi:hypothetical protein
MSILKTLHLFYKHNKEGEKGGGEEGRGREKDGGGNGDTANVH